MLVTDLPIMNRGDHPVGCKLLLRSLPKGVTARIGYILGHVGMQFVLHSESAGAHAVCDLPDLDYPTLRAMLDSLGHEKAPLRHVHEQAGHA